MVWNYRNADRGLKNRFIVLSVVIFGTLSVGVIYLCRRQRLLAVCSTVHGNDRAGRHTARRRYHYSHDYTVNRRPAQAAHCCCCCCRCSTNHNHCKPTVIIRYDTRCYFNVRSKANMSQLNLLEHSDSDKKKFRFDSMRQSDKFAACTLIFK